MTTTTMTDWPVAVCLVLPASGIASEVGDAVARARRWASTTPGVEDSLDLRLLAGVDTDAPAEQLAERLLWELIATDLEGSRFAFTLLVVGGSEPVPATLDLPCGAELRVRLLQAEPSSTVDELLDHLRNLTSELLGELDLAAGVTREVIEGLRTSLTDGVPDAPLAEPEEPERGAAEARVRFRRIRAWWARQQVDPIALAAASRSPHAPHVEVVLVFLDPGHDLGRPERLAAERVLGQLNRDLLLSPTCRFTVSLVDASGDLAPRIHQTIGRLASARAERDLSDLPDLFGALQRDCPAGAEVVLVTSQAPWSDTFTLDAYEHLAEKTSVTWWFLEPVADLLAPEFLGCAVAVEARSQQPGGLALRLGHTYVPQPTDPFDDPEDETLEDTEPDDAAQH